MGGLTGQHGPRWKRCFWPQTMVSTTKPSKGPLPFWKVQTMFARLSTQSWDMHAEVSNESQQTPCHDDLVIASMSCPVMTSQPCYTSIVRLDVDWSNYPHLFRCMPKKWGRHRVASAVLQRTADKRRLDVDLVSICEPLVGHLPQIETLKQHQVPITWNVMIPYLYDMFVLYYDLLHAAFLSQLILRIRRTLSWHLLEFRRTADATTSALARLDDRRVRRWS